MIVYTANFGNKDIVRPESFHLVQDIEYVYFSDINYIENLNGRTLIVEPLRFNNDPVKTAKWYKLHSHILFPGKITLWLDANYGASKINKLLDLTNDFEHVMLQPHYSNCPYEEANICLKSGKVSNIEKFLFQIETYKKEGMPIKSPNYRGGIIFRKSTAETIRFNTLWWNEIEKWQLRDQLSLAYIIWKYNIKVSFFLKKGYIGRRGNHFRKN